MEDGGGENIIQRVDKTPTNNIFLAALLVGQNCPCVKPSTVVAAGNTIQTTSQDKYLLQCQSPNTLVQHATVECFGSLQLITLVVLNDPSTFWRILRKERRMFKEPLSVEAVTLCFLSNLILSICQHLKYWPCKVLFPNGKT